MPDVPIVIRGTGLITPLGDSVETTWQNLLAGESIRTHSRAMIPARNAGASAPSPGTPGEGWEGGSEQSASPARSPLPNPPPAYRRRGQSATRVNQLASAAATEALFTSQWPKALVGDTSTALVVATSKGGADDWLNERNPAGESSPCFGLAGVADAVAREIRHGDGPRLTLSGACASGLHALIRATMLIEHGDADRAIVVAAESSMHPLFLQSFRRLGVLPADGERCRPFDLNRTGFLVSEAAAAVILERASGDAAARQSPEIAIDRYAFAGDAGHLTGFSGGTLRRLLRHVIGQQSVDLIHAHGTGTEANDATELAAIESVLAHSATGEDAITPPLVYSHKGAIGHTLGAAGLVSIVLNVQAHREGIVPANANLQSPLPSQSAIICRELSRRHIRRSVSAAAGFGGATAAVSLRSRGDQLPQV